MSGKLPVSRSDFACKCGCGFDTIDYGLMRILIDIDKNLQPGGIVVYSGCRCREYNDKVQRESLGDSYKPYSSKSQHMFGRAADIVVSGFEPEEVYQYLADRYKGFYGIGKYKTFTHIDSRTKGPARW